MALNQKGFLRESWKEKSMPSMLSFFKNRDGLNVGAEQTFLDRANNNGTKGGQPQI